jgi:hypothetical protein
LTRGTTPFNSLQKQRSEFGDLDTAAKKTEAEALRVLEQFAKTKLTPHAGYDDMFGLTIFFLQLQREGGGA